MNRQAWQQIVEHASQDAPLEACGYLVGCDGVVVEAVRMRNAEASALRFRFDPAEQIRAVHAVWKKGCQILGVYHSHPVSPALPSREDIRLAFDASLYSVIVSLVDGVPDVRSFRIEHGAVAQEEIELLPVLPDSCTRDSPRSAS